MVQPVSLTAGAVLSPGDDFVDAVQVFRIVLALGLRLADEGRRHQLMVALAVIDLVRLQLDVVRQLEILQRRGELDRVGCLLRFATSAKVIAEV